MKNIIETSDRTEKIIIKMQQKIADKFSSKIEFYQQAKNEIQTEYKI